MKVLPMKEDKGSWNCHTQGIQIREIPTKTMAQAAIADFLDKQKFLPRTTIHIMITQLDEELDSCAQKVEVKKE